MNFNIYINDTLGEKLLQVTKDTGETRNAIIKQALEEWIQKKMTSSWPPAIMEFQGFPDFEGFETFRHELKEQEETLFL